MVKDEKGLLSSALEEYKALRAEVNTANDRQYPIVNWGLTSLAVIIAAIASNWDKFKDAPSMPFFLVLFALPLIITAYVVAWSRIIVRMARVGSYIFLIEKKINALMHKSSGYVLSSVNLEEEPKHETETGVEAKQAEKKKAEDTEVMMLPIGWEHNLWKEKSHEYISRVPDQIKWILASVYVGSAASALVIVLAAFKKEDQGTGLLTLFVAAFFWAGVAVAAIEWVGKDVAATEKQRKEFEGLSLTAEFIASSEGNSTIAQATDN